MAPNIWLMCLALVVCLARTAQGVHLDAHHAELDAQAEAHRHIVDGTDTELASSRLLELGEQVRALAQEVGANSLAETAHESMLVHHKHRHKHKNHHKNRRNHRRHHHQHAERFKEVFSEARAEQDSWVPEQSFAAAVPRFEEADPQAAPAPVQAAPAPVQAAPAQAPATAPAAPAQQPVSAPAPAPAPAPAVNATPVTSSDPQASSDTLESLKTMVPAAVTPTDKYMSKNQTLNLTTAEPDLSKQPAYIPSQPQRNTTCPENCNWNGYCSPDGTCTCKPTYSGPSCKLRSCAPGCGDHGNCQEATGECTCQPGYCGVACDMPCCPYNCHERGWCDHQVCRCRNGFEGLYCQELTGCPGHCNPPHGECRNSSCYCADGWTGPGCELKICPGRPNTCNSNGRCEAKAGVCHCDPGYFGEACELKKCPNDCSGMGECDYHTGKCKCNPGFYGQDCAPQNCKQGCSGHGVCRFSNVSAHAYCECQKGWAGDGCETELCPQSCGGPSHGLCTASGCNCHANWTGTACQVRQCPLNCTSPLHGVCDNVTWSCSCLKGWTGDGCEAAMCKQSCNFRGVCNNGTCECNDWWKGPTCAEPQCKKNDKGQACSNHGRCIMPQLDSTPSQALERALNNSANPQSQVNAALDLHMHHQDRAQCLCDSGWGGVDCSVKQCPSDCNGMGICLSGSCFCSKGWYGIDCSLSQKEMLNGGKNVSAGPLALCLKTCKNGKCMMVKHHSKSILSPEQQQAQAKQNAPNASQASRPQPESVFECYCADGWAGPHCDKSLTSCDPRCMGADGICRPDCDGKQVSSCPLFADLPCGGPERGSCNATAGNCVCKQNFGGEACELVHCPHDCSGHGLCSTKEHKCLCYTGWAGDGCEVYVGSH